MKIKDFRLWQRGIADEWAIKIKKIGKLYEVWYVPEESATLENVKFWTDPVVNMSLEMFQNMFENEWFIKFKEQWWSTLKASDCDNNVLDSFADIKDMKKQELIDFLSLLKLWKPRNVRYVDALPVINIDEETSNWE